MLTRADFNAAVQDNLSKYPELSARFSIADPTFMRQLDAIFTALAMKSAEDEVALAEPQNKTRPATVLADAAIRGIMPKASPARFLITVQNDNDTTYLLDSARVLTDSSGVYYVVEAGVTVPAGGNAQTTVRQVEYTVITHTVTESRPFYFIPVPQSDSDAAVASISVIQGDVTFENRQEYINCAPDEAIYHVEVDAQQQVYVRFGAADVVGIQPDVGDVFEITIGYSMGEIDVEIDSSFSFEYVNSADDTSVLMSMSALVEPGVNPPSVSYLRELCKYPALYDEDAVFLGEFEFLVRKHFPHLKFLSVWNEALEEDLRGPALENMNRLFVSCFFDTELTKDEPYPQTPEAPERIYSSDLTGTQLAIVDRIARADDTYNVVFYTPVTSKLYVTVDAVISSAYVSSTVTDEIVELLLKEYGDDSDAARKGRNYPKNRTVSNLLESNIQALGDSGSDFTVTVDSVDEVRRPELWRFVTADSITVNITTRNSSVSSWGG